MRSRPPPPSITPHVAAPTSPATSPRPAELTLGKARVRPVSELAPTPSASTGSLSPRSDKTLPPRPLSPGRAASVGGAPSPSGTLSSKEEAEAKRQAVLKRVEDYKKKQAAARSAESVRNDPLLDNSSSSDDEELPARVSPRAALSGSTSPRTTATSPRGATTAKYRTGDEVEAKWKDDGIFYAARVDKIFVDGTAMVTFTEYGNQQRCTAAEIRSVRAPPVVTVVPPAAAQTTLPAVPAKRVLPRTSAVVPPPRTSGVVPSRTSAVASSKPESKIKIVPTREVKLWEEEDDSDQPPSSVEEPPSVLSKIMNFFGAEDSSEAMSPVPAPAAVLQPDKQEFFDNLFASTNDLSLSDSGFFDNLIKK